MAEVAGARSTVDIKLGQITNLKGKDAYEMQLVYNSVHLLGQYLDVLRGSLESNVDQTPDQSLSFRRVFNGKLVQDTQAGAIVSPYTGGIINGVNVIGPTRNPINRFNNDFNKFHWGLHSGGQFVALESGEAGDTIRIGVGPGVLKVTGVQCGQLVWGCASRTLRALWTQSTGAEFGYYQGSSLIGDGGVYLTQIGGAAGVNSPGYPIIDGGNSTLHSKIYFYPIGIGILDDYVLIAGALPG